VYRPPSSLVRIYKKHETKHVRQIHPFLPSSHLQAKKREETNVERGLELLDTLDRVGNDEDLTPLDLLPLDTSKEGAHVVTGLSSLKLLVEHLDAGEDGLHSGSLTDDLDLGTLGDGSSLDSSGDDGSSSGDGEDV
jgi:hypothetical protein